MIILPTALLLLAPIAPQEAVPDLVVTTEGRDYEGQVVYEDEAKLVLLVGSREREFATEELEKVRSVSRSLRDLLDRLLAVDPTNINATKDLARFARSRGLHGEARALWLRVLLLDANDEDANEALDNRKRGDHWELRHENRWWTLEDLKIRTKDWGEAWEFQTAHFDLHTNIKLSDAIALVFDLERTYLSYFEFMWPGVEVHETNKRMRVQVHADATSFPELAGSRRAYIDGELRTAFLDASAGLERGLLIHETCHLIAFMTTVEARRSRGRLPAWLDEGLAEYFDAAAHGPLGQAVFTFGDKNYYHFKEHATTGDPYEITRVVQFGLSDYLASSGTQLKYAQSYTLTDYFLHGEDEAYRERFFVFLQRCIEGRNSSTHLENALGIDLEEIEDDWSEYVEKTSRGG